MADQPYTTRDGWFSGGDEGWAVVDGRWTHLRTNAPCLVVTGDLDAARRRLAPPAVSGDTRTRAIDVATEALRIIAPREENAAVVVDALIAAGLLGRSPENADLALAGDRETASLQGIRRAPDDARDRAIEVMRPMVAELFHVNGLPADSWNDADLWALAVHLDAAGLLGPSNLDRLAAGRSPVDVLAGLLLLDRFRNSRTGWDVDNATWAVQQAQRDYAAALAVASEQTDG